MSIKLLKKPFKNDEQKPINKWKNEKNDKISGNSTVIVKNHGKQNFTDKTDERKLFVEYLNEKKGYSPSCFLVEMEKISFI